MILRKASSYSELWFMSKIKHHAGKNQEWVEDELILESEKESSRKEYFFLRVHPERVLFQWVFPCWSWRKMQLNPSTKEWDDLRIPEPVSLWPFFKPVNMEIDRKALEEWQKQQPLCILSLDPADRAVLRIAGRTTVPKMCGASCFPVSECNFASAAFEWDENARWKAR